MIQIIGSLAMGLCSVGMFLVAVSLGSPAPRRK
jgi:hypothetical protein